MNINVANSRVILDQRIEIALNPLGGNSPPPDPYQILDRIAVRRGSALSPEQEQKQREYERRLAERISKIKQEAVEEAVKNSSDPVKTLKGILEAADYAKKGAKWGSIIGAVAGAPVRSPAVGARIGGVIGAVAGGVFGFLDGSEAWQPRAKFALADPIARLQMFYEDKVEPILSAISEALQRFIIQVGGLIENVLSNALSQASEFVSQIGSSLSQAANSLFGGGSGLGGLLGVFSGGGGSFGGGGASGAWGLGGDASLGWGSMGMEAVAFAHSGGVIGEGGLSRYGYAFPTGATKYHRGGIAGLASNEIPAILQRGEEVLTRRDSRHRANLASNLSIRGLAGLSGATANRPSGGQYVQLNYNIDARGADAGVEARIKVAMRETEKRTLAAVNDLANRGGSYSKTLGRRQQR